MPYRYLATVVFMGIAVLAAGPGAAQIRTNLPPVNLNSYAATDNGSDDLPRLATDGKGKWVAVWQSDSNINGSGSDGDIWVARSSDDGLSWTPSELLTHYGRDDNDPFNPGEDNNPRIATDGKGTWIVVWQSRYDASGNGGGDLDILFSRSTDNGQTWSEAAYLNSYAEEADENSADVRAVIATDNRGNWVAVWETDYDLEGSGTDMDLAYARSTDGGQTWSPAALLNDSGTRDGDVDGWASMAMDSAGRTVVAWHSRFNLDDNSGTDYDIFYTYSTNAGESWEPTNFLNDYHAETVASDSVVHVATNGNGIFIAAWYSDYDLNASGTDTDIVISRSLDGGATWEAATVLNEPDGVAVDSEPRIVGGWGTHWAVVWPSNFDIAGTSGPDFDILGTVSFDNGASWQPIQLVNEGVIDTGNDWHTDIISDGRGRYLAAWKSESNHTGNGTDGDLLVTRVALTGGTFDAELFSLAAPTVYGPIGVQVLFSHDTVALDASDFETDNCIVSHVVGTGNFYYILVTPIAPGPFSVHLPQGAVPSTFGVDNTASNIITCEYTPPANGEFSPGDPGILNSSAGIDGIGGAFTDAESDLHAEMDSAGNGIVVWRTEFDLDGNGNEGDIVFSRTSDGGVTWGNVELLSDIFREDTGDDRMPVVATDGGSTWIVAWASTWDFGGTAGADLDIVFTRSTDFGVTWSPVAALAPEAFTDGGFVDTAPSIAGDGNGNWVAVWPSNYNPGDNTGDVDIVYSYSSDNGETWSPQQILNSNYRDDGGADSSAQVATDGNGTWICVWQGRGEVESQDIFYAKSTDGGQTWTDISRLFGTTSAEEKPSIATDRKGNWVVVFESDNDLDGDGFDERNIVASTSFDDGETWSDAVVVSKGSAGEGQIERYSPAIRTDRRGTWFCAWHGVFDPGDLDTEIVGAVSFDNGITWISERPLNTTWDSDNNAGDDDVHVVDDGNGNWLTIWRSALDHNDVTGDDIDILYTRFVLKDPLKPAVALSTTAPAYTNSSILVTVEFSEEVFDFDEGDIGVVNGTISNFSGTGSSYSFLLTPATEGGFSTVVPAGVCVDVFGNQNEASNLLVRNYDVTPPQVTLSSTTPNVTSGIIAVELVADGDATVEESHLTVSNATVSGFGGARGNYTFTLVPVANGPVSVQVLAGAFTDDAGNANLASNILTRIFDNVPPEVVLSTAAPDPVDGAITVDVALSEPVNAFTINAITTINATVDDFTGGGDSYSFTLVPTSLGSFSAQVQAGAFTDDAGNGNTASNVITRLNSPLPTCLDACAADPDPVDEDGDGLTACMEACYGSDDTLLDSDDDGMPDAFEGAFNLDNTLDDSGEDPDGDGLTNLEEFLLGSDPTNPNSPATLYYVSPDGEDAPGRGAEDTPWKTITYGIGNLPSRGGRILVAEGVYEEDVQLTPGVSIGGMPDEEPIIVGEVSGAADASLSHLELHAPHDGATLLTIDDVVMQVSDVVFSGMGYSGVRGLSVSGLESVDSVIERCDFTDLDEGIRIANNIPTIRRSSFAELDSAGVVIEAGVFDERDRPLGDETDSTTGFNTFYRTKPGSKSIINLRATSILMENNAWNTDDRDEATGSVSGDAELGPMLPVAASLFAGALHCTVWDKATQARLTSASVSVAPGVFAAVTKNVDGVYSFPSIPTGPYGVTVKAQGYEDGTMNLFMPEGQVVSIIIALKKKGGAPQSADYNNSGAIELSELLRGVQLYNAAQYRCGNGDDGYTPGIAGHQDCPPHSSDYNPQDWRISLNELLRLIQFFNVGGYTACANSEDGYCPGKK